MTQPITNPLERDPIYRVCLYSSNVMPLANVFEADFQVDIPSFIKSADIGKYHIACEEFMLANSSTQLGLSRTLIVEADLAQPDTYSTSTKTNSKVLFTMSRAIGGSALSYYKPITLDTYGIPLVDVNFLRTQRLRIRLKRVDDLLYDNTTTVTGMGASYFEMTLAIYPFQP